jgi:hypothetical protein
MSPLPPSLVGIYANQPTDINFLITNRFRLVLRRAPSCVYFVQQCNLPGFNMDNATQATTFVQVPVPGDRIHYNDFIITFPVDEQMKNYREIADWIIGLGFPKQFGQYADLDNSMDGIESDIGLIILDADQNPMHIVKFVGAFPVSISDIQFDTKGTDTVIPMVTVAFKYTYWQFDEVNIGSKTITPADASHNPQHLTDFNSVV